MKDLNWLHKEDNKIANEQMKECSTGWLSEKCELKCVIRCYQTPTNIRKADNVKCWRCWKTTRTLINLLAQMLNGMNILENRRVVSYKVKYILLYNHKPHF